MGTNWSAGAVPCIVFPGLRVVLNHIPCIENIHVVDLFVLFAVTCMKEVKDMVHMYMYMYIVCNFLSVFPTCFEYTFKEV